MGLEHRWRLPRTAVLALTALIWAGARSSGKEVFWSNTAEIFRGRPDDNKVVHFFNTGWTITVPNRSLLPELSGHEFKHYLKGDALRRSFPGVGTPDGCGYEMDLRVWSREDAGKSVEEFAQGYAGEDAKLEKVSQAGHTAYWTSHYFGSQSWWKGTSGALWIWFVLDTGQDFIAYRYIVYMPDRRQAARCSMPYMGAFKKMMESLKPINGKAAVQEDQGSDEGSSGAVPLLR